MPVKPGPGRFPATRWTTVLSASSDGSPAADDALARLCETYWYPLYAYLRGRGYSVEVAEDLTQAFFTQLLEKRLLRHADPARGRFRSFMLTSLKNFAANEHDRQTAIRRGGGTVVVPIDANAAEDRYRLEPATDETPERVFDRRWGVALLDRALTRLLDEATAASKDKQHELITMYVAGEGADLTHAEAGAALGMTAGAVKQTVHRLKRRYKALIFEEAAHTVASLNEVENEIRHLWKSVGK